MGVNSLRTKHDEVRIWQHISSGLKDRTFFHSHAVGRNEFAGTGFRNPSGHGYCPQWRTYTSSNRSYENRPDGVHMTVVTLDEEYISAFGEVRRGRRPVRLAHRRGPGRRRQRLRRRRVAQPRHQVQPPKANTSASGARPAPAIGEFNGPSGLAIDSQGNMVVVDSKNNRVQKYTLDGASFISSFGSEGSGDGQFNMPWGIAIDKDDNVYIADWRNDRIQVFNSAGEWQQSIGESGDGVGQFNRPNGVAVDADGDIYVADWMNNRVQVFAPDGRFITLFRGDARPVQVGQGQAEFRTPT